MLIIGDLNEDHFNRDKIKEQLVKELIQELELEDLGREIGELPTYVTWTKAVINNSTHEGLNTSTHNAVSTSVICQKPQFKSKKKKKQVSIKYKWTEVNVGKFAATVDEVLQEGDIKKLNPEHAIEVFQRALQTATEVSVPATRVGSTKI